MKLKIQRRTTNQDQSLIPLVNIVFLLLVFFMLAGEFRQPQSNSVELPTSNTNPVSQNNSETLVVLKSGDLLYKDRKIPFADRSDFIKSFSHSGQSIDIRSHYQSPANRVLEIIRQLKSNGAIEINLVTRRVAP